MIEEVQPGIILIGTAHVSPQSVEQVRDEIRQRRPAKVLVELDAKRYAALKDPDAWLKTDIVQVIRQKKQSLFLLQLYLANMQARLGTKAGASPGSEMLAAAQAAEEVGAELVLVDRDIGITLKRLMGSMGVWARMRLAWRFMSEVFVPADGAAEDPEEQLKQVLATEQDAITRMTDEFAQFAPEAKVALIDERDDYMASHILEQAAAAGIGAPAPASQEMGFTSVTLTDRKPPASNVRRTESNEPVDDGQHVQAGPTGTSSSAPNSNTGIIAVVGAGHCSGIKARIASPATIRPRAQLDRPPKRRFPWVTVINLAISILIAVGISMLVSRGDSAQAVHFLGLWIALHFLFAGIGASLAVGHPLAVLTGASIAPFTSILPVGIKSGWVAGLVQATLRKPTVGEFAAIKGVEKLSDFWLNPVVKVLTVTSMTILGSELANIVCAVLLAKGLM